MNIQNFDQLVAVARAQPIPQRLLLVFASAELPDDATAEQRADFLVGKGGALVPSMMLDRAPEEMGSFADLVQEASQFSRDWRVLFIAALSSKNPVDLSDDSVNAALQTMTERIHQGDLGHYLPLDREGNAIRLNRLNE